MADNTKQNKASVQNVFVIGSKSFGQTEVLRPS